MTEARDRYHHGNLAASLVEVGMAMIETRRDSELSLREVARQAAVSPTAVYRHYADKDALLSAISTEGFNRLNAAFRSAGAAHRAASPLDRFGAFGNADIEFALGHPGLYRLMFGEGRHDVSLSQTQLAVAEASYRQLETAVRDILGKGALPKAVTALAIAAWSVVHGYATLHLNGQFRMLPAETIPDVETVLGSLVPPAASRPPSP